MHYGGVHAQGVCVCPGVCVPGGHAKGGMHARGHVCPGGMHVWQACMTWQGILEYTPTPHPP